MELTMIRYFDSDAHMIEPPNLWVERIEKKFLDRAPRGVKNPPNVDGPGLFFVCEDSDPLRLSTMFEGGRQNVDANFDAGGLENCPPGAWDPYARLKDMEADGACGAALYSSVGFSLFGIKDPELQESCFEVYNNWLAEFCSVAPDKFAGMALISLWNPKRGAKELERCFKLGLKGAMIWAQAPMSQPYKSPIYDPFWAAAQELSAPLILHEATGQRRIKVNRDRDAVDLFLTSMQVVHEIEETVIELIFAGVLERFSNLKIVAAEIEIGWVAPLFSRLDKYYRRLGSKVNNTISMPPSDYFRRQIYATFIDDAFGVKTYGEIGADNFLWSTDYPHNATTWPNSQKTLPKCFAGVPEGDVRKMILENGSKLFGLSIE
jgi:predicted TIM-barrel fold metal-dependent hydrolase